MKKLNICIVTEYFPSSPEEGVKGGVEARSYNIAKRLAKNHEVTIVCSWQKEKNRENSFENMKIFHAGPNHPYTHHGSIFTRLGFARAAYKKVKELDKEKNFDVVDGYNFISYIPANLSAKQILAKSIATYHEVWIGEWVKNKGLLTGTLGSIWERVNLHLNWDKIVAVSDFTKKRLEKQGVQNVEIIHNGVDIIEFKQLRKLKRFKEPTICFVARLTPKKRAEDLIRALAVVKKTIPKIHCKIIGTGDERENLGKLVKELDLEKNTEFLGFVKDYEDVKKVMRQSHVFGLPSILEGFGMVIIEAMASGTPYVCSDIEVLKEVTENGKGGLLFKQQNSEDLAEKLLQLLTDKELHAKKVSEGEKFVEKYDWEKIVKKTESVYRSL